MLETLFFFKGSARYANKATKKKAQKPPTGRLQSYCIVCRRQIVHVTVGCGLLTANDILNTSSDIFSDETIYFYFLVFFGNRCE